MRFVLVESIIGLLVGKHVVGSQIEIEQERRVQVVRAEVADFGESPDF